MNEAIRSFPILERCGPLDPLLRRMAHVIASKPNNPAPMVALVVPNEEHGLLNAALDVVWQRFSEKRRGLETATDPAHTEPHVLDIVKLLDTKDWQSLQELLLGTPFQAYTVLVTDRDPGELLEQGKISKSLRSAIGMTFCWPDPAKRTASMKRDYFLHAVTMMDARVGEELGTDHEARKLLKASLSASSQGANLLEIARLASDYLNYFGNLDPSKKAVEVLEHFIKHMMDESRVTTPPMGEETSDTDNATKVA